jgi:hypothetical protein
MKHSAPELSLAAFGLRFTSNFDLPGFQQGEPAPAGAVVSLEFAAPGDIRKVWHGDGEPVWGTYFGGVDLFRLHAGTRGDHLFTYAGAAFHLSSSADRLLCCPGNGAPADWKRVLLDTVMYCVSLIRGGVALHASAVELPGGAVAVVSASGSGKTTLAAELIRRGGRLLTDDVLFLRSEGDKVLGCPGPPLMNIPLGAEIDSVTVTMERFEGEPESWASIARASTAPVPVAAVFFLHRGEPHKGARVRPLDAALLPVLRHMVFLPHLAGAAPRFRVAADLASTTPLFALEADLRAAPADLASLIERSAGA